MHSSWIFWLNVILKCKIPEAIQFLTDPYYYVRMVLLRTTILNGYQKKEADTISITFNI